MSKRRDLAEKRTDEQTTEEENKNDYSSLPFLAAGLP